MQRQPLPARTEGPAAKPCEILIAVLPGVSLLGLGCLIEPLRHLRQIVTLETVRLSVFQGRTHGEDGDLSLACDRDLSDLVQRIATLPAPEAIFFCCGFDVPRDNREVLCQALRLARRANIPIFSIGASTWALAELGLLPDGQGAVHWSSLAAFRERNLNAEPLPKLFHLAARVSTCAGELACLDMIARYTRDRFGSDIADRICDRFLIGPVRGPEVDQPARMSNMLRFAPPVVRQVAMRMRQTVESPLRISSFVAETGISQRQIERLFQRHLNCSPRQYYLDLQLALAWQLCEQTEMSLLEVALVSGFGSNSSLARRFRQRFAVSSTELRASRLP